MPPPAVPYALRPALQSLAAQPVRVNENGSVLARTPLYDPMGDPIDVTLTLTHTGDAVVIDDAGAIAGALFSAGQDHEGSTARQLLSRLTPAHGATLDLDQATVTLNAKHRTLEADVLGFLALLTTMLTAIPHLRDPFLPDQPL